MLEELLQCATSHNRVMGSIFFCGTSKEVISIQEFAKYVTHWKAYWLCSEPSKKQYFMSKTRQDIRIVRSPFLRRNISIPSEYLGIMSYMLERTECSGSQESTSCSIQQCISVLLILLLSHPVNDSHFHTLQF